MNTTPYLPQGHVYGALLNFQREWAVAEPLMGDKPYQGAPQAPVLYLKTANTFSANGSAIALSPQVPNVEIGATIGMVMGEAGVAAWVLLGDLSIPHSLPHDGFYRPPVKYKCLDGFLAVGPGLRPHHGAVDAAAFQLQLLINGQLRQTLNFAELRRDAATLLRDVSEFMTLRPGDVLMLGCDCLPDGGRPLAQVGDRIELRCPGFAPTTHTLVSEATP